MRVTAERSSFPQIQAIAAAQAPACPPALLPEIPALTPAATEDSLALALAPVRGISGDEVEQAKAGERFRKLIEPVTNPERYPELHARFERKSDLLEYIAAENGLSARTLRRKLRRWEAGQINGLARPRRTDKGISKALNGAASEFIIAAALPSPGVYGELSTRDIFRLYEEERRWRANQAGKPLCQPDRARFQRYVGADGCLMASAQLPAASYRTFCRQVAHIPELVKTMARRGEEAYRNGELITHRDLASPWPLDYVVMDHRMLDIFCLIPVRRGWKIARPWLTAAIDMRTRKWLGWCVVETPSSDSIAAVLKRVFVDFGLPKSVYWDNGKDFRSQWFEGRRDRSRRAVAAGEMPEKWAGVLDSLGVRVHHAIAFRARSKIIEPCFQSVANFDRTLPEWCGHKPGTRPERFDKLLKEHEEWTSGERDSTPFRTIEEVARLYSDAIGDINERPHQGEGMRKVLTNGLGWCSPNEAWELLAPKVPRRSAPVEVLQLCFAKRRDLTIRNGEVCATFGGRPYHYRLNTRTSLLALNGRTAELGYDPLDLGEAAIYAENRFIGLAKCVELRKMGEDAFVEDERDRRAARREVKRFIAAVHQAVPVPDAETHLARRRAVTPARAPAEREEIAAEIPESIAAAHEASQAERAFSFGSETTTVQVERRPAPDDEDSGEFEFFGSASRRYETQALDSVKPEAADGQAGRPPEPPGDTGCDVFSHGI